MQNGKTIKTRKNVEFNVDIFIVVFVENMNCFILGKECIINLFVSCILAALLSFKSSEESKVQYSGQSAGIYPMF